MVQKPYLVLLFIKVFGEPYSNRVVVIVELTVQKISPLYGGGLRLRVSIRLKLFVLLDILVLLTIRFNPILGGTYVFPVLGHNRDTITLIVISIVVPFLVSQR